MRIDPDNRLLNPLRRLLDASLEVERLEACHDLFDSIDDDGDEDREISRTLHEWRHSIRVAVEALREEVKA